MLRRLASVFVAIIMIVCFGLEAEAQIREAFLENASDEYNLITNNCAQVVVRALEAGGINISKWFDNEFYLLLGLVPYLELKLIRKGWPNVVFYELKYSIDNEKIIYK